jgi:hypothetical protein
VSTKQFYGGACNVTGRACSTVLSYKYVTPQRIIDRIKGLKPGEHYSLQTYVLVTGKSPKYTTNTTRWDCTAADPNQHWSNDVERYCWVDFKTILRSLQSNRDVTVTDPQGVAIAWRMAPPAM